jgi:3-hydroxyacyl-CoA dehydrogenase
VIGVGIMGTGIALACAKGGHEISLLAMCLHFTDAVVNAKKTGELSSLIFVELSLDSSILMYLRV